jgi:hypothetical protein
MKRLGFYLGLFCLYCLNACSCHSGSKQAVRSKLVSPKEVPDSAVHEDIIPDSGKPDLAVVGADSAMEFYAVAGNRYVRLGTINLRIPDNTDINAVNIYTGIYELKNDSLVRHKFLVTKRTLFLCTFDDVGMGYRARLYVYDLTHRCFIRDPSFDYNYLYSSAGIFVIDRQRIFVPGKSERYDAKKEGIIPASLYAIKGRYFRFVKNVYEKGDRSPNDTTGLLSFVNASISEGRNKVLPLPSDWWKAK